MNEVESRARRRSKQYFRANISERRLKKKIQVDDDA